MKRSLLPFLLLAACAAYGQQRSGPFDAVACFASLTIQRAWSVDGFPIPAYANRTFTDSLWSSGELVGFTVRLTDRDSTGWRAWLTFDADKNRVMRLSGAFAQKPLRVESAPAFHEFVTAIDSAFGRRIFGETPQGDSLVSWQWTARTGYRLTARRVSRTSTQPAYHIMRIHPVSGD
jgi:hypothetical protein